MLRTFNLVLAASGALQNLYTLMRATAGAVPTDGILPDRCQELTLIVNAGNPEISDANGEGKSYAVGESMTKRSAGSGNRICLRDYNFTGAGAGAEQITVEVEYW